MKSQDACEDCHDGSCQGSVGDFPEKILPDGESGSFFGSIQRILQKNIRCCGSSGLSRRSVQPEHCICLGHGGKTAKGEYGCSGDGGIWIWKGIRDGSDSRCDLQNTGKKQPDRMRDSVGILDHEDQDRVKDQISSDLYEDLRGIKDCCIQRKH